MNCNRTACQTDLKRHVMLIWNEPSRNIPRVYCIKCGRKIIDGNQWDTIKLQYEVTTAEDAKIRFPSLDETISEEQLARAYGVPPDNSKPYFG